MGENIQTQSPQRADDVAEVLRSIVSDRMMRDVPSVSLETMGEDVGEIIEANLTLLSFMNGHAGSRLREIARSYHSEEAQHVRELFEWSANVNPENVHFDAIVKTEIPDVLRDAQGEYDIYERLQLKERHPDVTGETYEEKLAQYTSRALGSEGVLLWKDVRDNLLDGNSEEHIRALLTHIGSIPTEIFTRNKFGGVDPGKVIDCINTLKKLEASEVGDLARYERARILNHFIARGSAEHARIKKQDPVQLDANGIRIHLRNLHAHIPYGLINDDLMRELQFGNWVARPQHISEIALRRAQENNDVSTAKDVQEQQEAEFLTAWKQDESIDGVANSILRSPDNAARLLMQQDVLIPDSLIEKMRTTPEGIYALIRLAEACGAHIAGERMTRKTSLFASYELGEETGRAYHARKQLLSDPRYYQSVKITRAILSHDLPEGTRMFKGEYKAAASGNMHAFVATMHDSKVARVLIDERRHIHDRQKTYRLLPRLRRDMYEQAEYELRTFHYVTDAIDQIEKLLKEKPKNYEKRLQAYREVVMHFALTNVTEHVSRIEVFGEPHQPIQEHAEQDYIEALRAMQESYQKFLRSRASESDVFIEEMHPALHVKDTSMTTDDIDSIKKQIAADGYDEYLFEQEPTFRVVELSYREDDPTKTIPYHIEESCLDALRVNRNRPLINIVGGCRKQDSFAEYAYADVIARIAHEHTANVAIPGTQSGVGIAFGRAAVAYRQSMADVPKAEQAHYFSVTPAANAYYSGNPFANMAPQNERFAISPVDSVLTPFSAQWEKWGMERFNIDYDVHVRYMEALFARMSHEQPHVMIVGGGGWFSILEASGALRANAEVMLLSETGRFASVCAEMLNHIEQLPEDEDMFYNWMIPVLDALPDDIREEFERKDFGFDDPPEDENVHAFRTLLFRFAQTLEEHADRIRVSSVENIEADVEELLAS